MHKKIRSEIRKRYEAGEDLISLSIEYKVNYGTLKNISSKEKWEKGILEKITHYKEIFELANKNVQRRELAKEEYKILIEKMRKELISDENSNIKVVQEARRAKSQAIKELYAMDKELHGIMSEKEMLEYKIESKRYEKLMKEVQEIEKYQTPIFVSGEDKLVD